MNQESSRITTITARIPNPIADELRAVAQEEGRTINNYLRRMLPIWMQQEKEKKKQLSA
jgi:hypothetical protein